jgi:hypothetical protein
LTMAPIHFMYWIWNGWSRPHFALNFSSVSSLIPYESSRTYIRSGSGPILERPNTTNVILQSVRNANIRRRIKNFCIYYLWHLQINRPRNRQITGSVNLEGGIYYFSFMSSGELLVCRKPNSISHEEMLLGLNTSRLGDATIPNPGSHSLIQSA